MPEKKKGFAWKFQRLGGLDQVVLQDADDLRRLAELDPKLWVAISCPAAGLEFDPRTLALIDSDKDGRIRIPEVLAAVQWTCARLKRPDDIIPGDDALPLDAIDDQSPEGQRLLATARAIIDGAGGGEKECAITQEGVARAVAHASEQLFNGDGVLTQHPGFDPDVQDFIRDAIAVVGGVEDASGRPGVDDEAAAAFVQTLSDWRGWRRSVHEAANPLGDHTAEAWELLRELKPKIDDYFLRCELVAYAPGAAASLNGGQRLDAPAEHGLLDMEALADYPIARVAADRPLNLAAGLNPAWRARVERFAELVRRAGAGTDEAGGEHLSRRDWLALQERFAPYAAALTRKPAAAAAPGTTIPPAASPDKLGDDRVRAILDGDVYERFRELSRRDRDVPASASDIAEVERLVLYHRHLYRLLMNFVSFRDFYSLTRNAIFQAGELFIDGRGCRLCMPAGTIDDHAALAVRGQFFLLYCRCQRGRKPGGNEPAATVNIVAAVTAGDSDLLTVGRNGVFVDNRGEDWDATVVKVVSNPIGLWQAMWSPYKKFGNLITEQINKFASDKQDSLMAGASKTLGQIGQPPAAGTAPTAAPAFDIGRNVGILAAVGLALGAIGTALASIADALFGLAWWQFPLLIAGLVALVSGPSVLMAWLKLRQRTLGPLLEASGWAVNGHVAINWALSDRLTAEAALPADARRNYLDPWEDARRRRRARLAFFLAMLAGAAAAAAWLWLRN